MSRQTGPENEPLHPTLRGAEDAEAPLITSTPRLPGEQPFLDPMEIETLPPGLLRGLGPALRIRDRRRLGGPPRRRDLSERPDELGRRYLQEITQSVG